jgi:hypothetical protein
MRRRIDQHSLRVVLSPRTLLRMAKGIEVLGMSFEQAVERRFLARLDPDTRELLCSTNSMTTPQRPTWPR